MRHHLLFCLSLVCAPLLAAEPAGSQDLEVLPRLARSVIVDYRDTPAAERRYPQDSLRRISGQLVAREVLVEGRLRALTYQLPEEHGPREALQIARQHLQAQGAQLLFWCEGRDCGSSSLWANQIFGSAKLYGPEEQQSYLLLRLAGPQDSLLALYGIVRGNRRAYLHVEQLDAGAPLPTLLPTAGTLLRQLRRDGQLQLALVDMPNDDWSALLVQTLRLDSTLRLGLSGIHADAWRTALQQQGVAATRLQLQGSEGKGLTLQPLR
ncbi:DUF4892 domain-containing protein [Aquipseudomonas alcaligenes]|jgi:hypothetical protein|uniref:DUF4892 domain-containing protein n=1 Tax=Aquipseudomonas alcaligenes TaxID=43263 RepID=A0AB73HUH9_AQUAC|nr:DUF4892 domain-containing protein [Pseudomonas alcaligenes]MDH0141394.1 DUF4892 domain-containing protein [Pseudomonas alcaligenes]